MQDKFTTLIIGLLFLGCFFHVNAQDVSVVIRDSTTGLPLRGANIVIHNFKSVAFVSDTNGVAKLRTLQSGLNKITISLVGYQKINVSLELPRQNRDSIITFLLVPAEADLEEVIVTASRTNRRIEELPIKVEVLGQEDMDEESAVVPGNVSSILGDISIIHVQRTSLTTGNQGIRMQGLDPKYTQILRDGLPLFEGFSGNLGVLQIPPLDLKQIEIVKGSASTLYGGGAVGGLLNLVSRRPGAKPELTTVLNRSTLRETNLNTYYSSQWSSKVGLTLFAGVTNQPALDVNHDGYADSPLIKQFTLHPSLFLNPSDKTRLKIGYTLIAEKRTGGDVVAIKGADPSRTYVVNNKSFRNSLDATLDQQLSASNTLTGKGTVSFFNRTQRDNGYLFCGKQLSGYFEAADYAELGKHTIVAGTNVTIEQFRKDQADSSKITDYSYQTLGVFVQDDYKIGKFTFQGGLRFDHHNVFGNFVLPRLSILIKPIEHWTVRTSIGTGYKTPNTFANLTGADRKTSLSYRYLLPISTTTRPERSVGLNMDVAYKGNIGEHLSIQLDQAFYSTNISNPVVAITDSSRGIRHTILQNASYNIKSIGTDTYLRMEYDEIEFYLGYNHTSAKRGKSLRGGNDVTNIGANSFLPYSPRDKFSLTLAYTIPDKWRFGIESSWVGNQYLYDNTKVPNYWFWAAAVERMFGKLSVILNAENVFNIQQIQYGPVVTGPRNNPTTAPLWAPQEGRIVNLALRYKLNQ